MKPISRFVGSAVFLLAGAPALWAVSSYNIAGPSDIMIGDNAVTISVDPQESGLPDGTPHRVKFIGLPAGVTVTPNDVVDGVAIAGPTNFTLFVGAAATPGPFTLTVQNQVDASVKGQMSVTIFRTVSQFTVTLPGAPFTAMAGVPFQVTLTARDSGGAVVVPFSDNVDISALVGDSSVNLGSTFVPGADFVNGVAVASVTLFGTTIGSLNNSITATAQLLYPGQVTRASGIIGLTVEPNVFDHILLAFPGENLTPGTGAGKTGAANTATAGLPVPVVNAFLVDQFHNPIRTDRNPEPGLYPVSVSFVSITHPGTDTVPVGQSVAAGNQLSMNNAFSFLASGVAHIIQTTEGTNGTTDSTSISVLSGAASSFEWSAIATPQSAVSPFAVTIRARDAIGNTVTTYNSAAVVSANDCVGTGLGANTVDVDQVTPGPQTSVTFVNGVWAGAIKVTKQKLNVCLNVDDSGGRIGDSNPFRVNTGPLSMLWFTLPGEIYTPGAYPGNALSPNSATAGDLMTVVVRAVDASWNQVALGGPEPLTLTSPTGYIDAPGPLTMPAIGDTTVAGVRVRTASPASQRLAGAITSTNGQSALFTVNPRPYDRVIVSLPGETLAPGVPPLTEPDGKTGIIVDQAVNTAFPISVYLTDDYFNPVLNPPVAGWPSLNFQLTTPVGGTVTFPAPNPFPMSGGSLFNTVTLGNLGTNIFKITDTLVATKTVTATLTVQPGPLDHFTVTGVSNKNAGDAMAITVSAFDQFNNIATNFGGSVRLELWSDGVPVTYDGAIVPSTITFVANPVTGGIVSTNVVVNYAGKQLGLGADRLQIRAYYNLPPLKEGFSAFFDIYELAILSGVVVVLPGQSFQPGGTPNKINSPDAKTAGDAIAATVYAVDAHGNKMNFNGPVNLSVPAPNVSASFSSPVNLVNGSGSTFGFIYTAGSHVVLASHTATGFTDTSTVQINPGSYTAAAGKLLLLAGGETQRPGFASGKSGAPTPIIANTNTTFTIVACDPFYNMDPAYSGGNYSLSSNDGAVSLTGINVTAGSATVTNLYLSGTALINPVRVTVTDPASPLNKTNYSDVPILPGAYFDVGVPSTTVVGAPFSMTVQLIDPLTGLPGPYNHTVFFEAQTSSGAPSTVSLGVLSANLVAGQVTLPLQHYDHVETIRIKITDNFSRLAYTANITVAPNGLKYVVTAPNRQTTDDTFPITIQLFDSIFDSFPIRTLDHAVSLRVEVGGLPAVGTSPVTGVSLNQGETQFNFKYTKAEHIVIIATGTVGAFLVNGSDDMDIDPGAYVKLQILAPGETAIPGIPSATGKDSSGLLPQSARETFSLTVQAVDTYWNVVSSVSSPATLRIKLAADDGSLAAQPEAPLVNGIANFNNIKLTTPPLVTVTAQDTVTPSVVSQSVAIPLTGRVYEATTVLNFGDYYTGPPRDFRLTVALFRFNGSTTTGLVSGTTGDFYVVPVDPSLQPLDVANLVNPTPTYPAEPNKFQMDPSGVVTLTLSYRTAENVIFRIYDADGWQGYSNNRAPVAFVPRDVAYSVTQPTESTVGPPSAFSMVIVSSDVDTGTVAKNFSSTFTITAIRVVNGLPGTGVLQVTNGAMSGGPVTLQQAYTEAGLFRFRVDDGTRFSDSPIINMKPGSLAGLSLALPGSLEAGTTAQIQVTLLDGFANPIPDLATTLSLDNNALGTLLNPSGLSNAFGLLNVNFQAATSGSGPGTFIARSGSFSASQGFRLLGPPVTSLSFSGYGRSTGKGSALKAGDLVTVNADYEAGMSLTEIRYSVDGGPYQVYAGPFALPGVGVHSVRHYGVTQAGFTHVESTRTSPTIYVSAATSSDEGVVNYPNPFQAGRDVTFLEYNLTQDSGVTLTIYDVMGQKIYETEVSPGQSGGQAGLNRLAWDGRNADGQTVGNGGYIAVLELRADGRTFRRKVAVRK